MRFTITLLAALALVLTGCGGADTTDTTGTADTTTDIAPDPTDDPGTEEPTEEPTAIEERTDAPPAGDCSAAGLDGTVEGEAVSEQARATAALLLDAAVRCDEQLLATAAEESETTFFFGSATVDEVFGLPEDADADPSAWEALARLLGSTTPVVGDGDVWTWPAAAAPDAGDDAWQELVDSGLYTEAQVDELRGAGEGYLGWRVGIESNGDWLFMTAGD